MPNFEADYIDKAFAHFVAQNHRMIVVLVGLGTKQHIPTLHARLGRASPLQSIIWCYKNAETAADCAAKKQRLADEDDPLVKWIKINNPEHILYKESSRVLGRTCDMLVLQDFEALSPNMAVTCIETVRGGGLVVLLLDQDRSLNQLIARKTDIHEGLGTDFEPIFNKRLFKSLIQTGSTIFLDSKMKVMNITQGFADAVAEIKAGDRQAVPALADSGPRPVRGPLDTLLDMCKTHDQRRVLERCAEIIDKNENATVSITAARGRGKSAAMGLAVAHAIQKGTPSVFISALFKENVQTLFELIIAGLQKGGYRKTVDFKVFYAFAGKKRSIYRILFPKTKQFIDYFHPLAELKAYPSLLVIDEAASIPLDHIKKLLPAGLVLMASTVGGYEGTGRAFKTKLIEYLKTKSIVPSASDEAALMRSLHSENKPYYLLELAEPIRYAKNDPVEEWLNKTLLLDASIAGIRECPLPSACQFYHINKTSLFCGAAETEDVLRELFSVFAASHYRNSPDDLQILADVRNHEVFALLSPSSRILCAVQVAFEGRVDRNAQNREGNLIPWVVHENFSVDGFLSCLGTRIVRIAVHPHAYSMGYGSEALARLIDMLEGTAHSSDLSYITVPDECKSVLFNPVDAIAVPKISWTGASFGLSEKLLGFWTRNAFAPVCVKQTASRSTGEYSAIVLRGTRAAQPHFDAMLEEMQCSFRLRIIPLLAYSFRDLAPSLCLALVHAGAPRTSRLRRVAFTVDEQARLTALTKGTAFIRNVLDLVPRVAACFFYGEHIQVLPVLHQSVLLMLGCQHKSLEDIARIFRLEEFQVGSILAKIVDTVLLDAELE